MIPLRDTTHSGNYPVVKLLLIAANAFLFFVQTAQGPLQDQFIFTYGLVPARYSVPEIGAHFTSFQQVLALVSFMFLHGGFWHLLMRDENITTGCNLAGTQYCPTGTVTRRAMSAFIIRALFGENFFVTPTPYFTDAPETNQFFKYIQRMRDENITTGCNPPDKTQYCPADNVTRQAMAAVIGRGFLSIP